jgi:nicotinate-nucleotide pyrophosphorylase (carboxylating)
MINEDLLESLLQTALSEDLGDGDHSSLSCIPPEANGMARLLVKDKGILAGIDIAKKIFRKIDPVLNLEILMEDGNSIKPGDVAFIVSGSVLSILKSERLALNVMQRMSGIASQTAEYVGALEGLKTGVLDTRKTAPGLRILDKEAVRIGGGLNHRMGLYDMIMLKDNHIDFAGGIEKAITKTRKYLEDKEKDLDIVIEARSLEDVREILPIRGVRRILLDNFSIPQTLEAVDLIGDLFETESSGKITLDNIREYAECGVDYISVGALTHQVRSLDLSLKAIH